MALNAKRLAKFCGPAAIASATGRSRLDVAEELIERGRRSPKTGATWVHEIAQLLGLEYESVKLPWEEQTLTETWVEDRRGRCYLRTVCTLSPTLARWLRDNPGRSAILRASHHFVHVHEGEVVEANGWEPRRGRVTHVIWLDEPTRRNV